MDMKLYFITCVYVIVLIDSFAAITFSNQQEGLLSCVSNDDIYTCYNTETEKYYNIPKSKMDELLELSVDQQFNIQEDFDNNYSLGESRSNNVPTTKRAYKRPSFLGLNRPSMTLYDLFVNYRRQPHSRGSFTSFRKRPFDSISYRGRFGGFGRKR
ncbi:Hypothetical predicted protein [Mytilus galloprovincialis]|uniref:Uncharacterized protein n=1 Tax=Mytilus galloprovincialis TaxID=29158 RepID=A0A8B6FYR9_MYTGA|nr:Hypothetical predicted protein [Mytilus galloprovincialis]